MNVSHKNGVNVNVVVTTDHPGYGSLSHDHCSSPNVVTMLPPTQEGVGHTGAWSQVLRSISRGHDVPGVMSTAIHGIFINVDILVKHQVCHLPLLSSSMAGHMANVNGRVIGHVMTNVNVLFNY